MKKIKENLSENRHEGRRVGRHSEMSGNWLARAPRLAQMPGLSVIVTTMPTAPIGNPGSTDDEQFVPADGLANLNGTTADADW